MKTIILAGGMGTRLRDVVSDVPKPMAPVGGKPFLEYIILALAAQGLNEIILSVGYKKEIIQSYFEDGSQWRVEIVYSEEDTPLGTGGAIREATKITDSPRYLILNGDTFNQLDFLKMENFHLSKTCMMTVGLIQKLNAGRYGSVKINKRFEITGFFEKSQLKTRYVNRGAYIIENTILDRMPSGRFSLENEFFPIIINTGVCGFISSGFFIDIGIPSTYRYINNHYYLLQQPNKGATTEYTAEAKKKWNKNENNRGDSLNGQNIN